MAAEKARYEQEMQAEREAWVEQQALQITTQLAGRPRAHRSIPVRTGRKHPQAFRIGRDAPEELEELEETLATILSGGEAKLLKITGPEDLLLSMKDRMGSHGDAIEFCPGEHVEVSVVARDTTLRTQFDAWSSRLKQALEG